MNIYHFQPAFWKKSKLRHMIRRKCILKLHRAFKIWIMYPVSICVNNLHSQRQANWRFSLHKPLNREFIPADRQSVKQKYFLHEIGSCKLCVISSRNFLLQRNIKATKLQFAGATSTTYCIIPFSSEFAWTLEQNSSE